MSDLDPTTFNLDDWISGASRPERTVTVYRDGHLLADLDDLEGKILKAESDGGGDRGVNDASPAALRAQWEQTAERFAASALPVRVRALTHEEYAQAHTEGVEACGGKDKAQPDVIGLHVIAAASVFPKMTPAQVKALRDAVGEAQVGVIAQAVTDLRTKGLPPVTAQFRRPRS